MEANELMAAQHGVASRKQLVQLGLTLRRIRYKLESGQWVAEERNVYRHASVPAGWYPSMMAACLAEDGVASHRSAAFLWGLDGFRTGRPEIAIPYRRRAQTTKATVRRTKQWDRIDLVIRDGVPTTGIERTILDLAAVLPLYRLELAAESALRQKLITWEALRRCLLRHSIQGRNGCGRLRLLLEMRSGEEDVPRSEWSRVVANDLHRAGLPKPVLEHRICDSGGLFIAEVDLAWPHHKLIIELDSVRYHLNRKSFELDRSKRNRLRLEGWTIMELTWSATMGDSETKASFAALIRQALTDRSGSSESGD